MTSTYGGLVDKFIIVENAHNFFGLGPDASLTHLGFAPSGTGDDYFYTDAYGDWRDHSPQYSKIEMATRLGQWVCVEYEMDHENDTAKAYAWTQDGTLNGLQIVTVNTEGLDTDEVTIIGGYYNRIHTNQDSNTYMLIDELEIDDDYIGPPVGFLNDAFDSISPASPSGLSVR